MSLVVAQSRSTQVDCFQHEKVQLEYKIGFIYHLRVCKICLSFKSP